MKRLVWLVGAASVMMVAAGLWGGEGGGPAGANGGTTVLNIRAEIDGRSRLILDDGTAQWLHLDFAAPGRHACNLSDPVEPTTINGTDWFPAWPDVPNCENRDCNCLSDIFAGLLPSIPNVEPSSVTLQPVDCRFSCSIVQFPSAGNGFEVVIQFDDNPPPGPTFYEVNLVIETAVQVDIDIKPGSDPNSINLRSRGLIPVSILSGPGFDAPGEVDRGSLTFGRTGDEDSLAGCPKSAEDTNGDGLPDQVCHFRAEDSGLQCGDTSAILRGRTAGGVSIEGEDSVRIAPGACR